MDNPSMSIPTLVYATSRPAIGGPEVGAGEPLSSALMSRFEKIRLFETRLATARLGVVLVALVFAEVSIALLALPQAEKLLSEGKQRGHGRVFLAVFVAGELR